MSMTANDIFYTLFRHKWRILGCTAAGLLIAAALYLTSHTSYESEAELFIRFVVDEGAPKPPGTDAQAVSTDGRGESIIATEVELLRSLDVAYLVVDAVGQETILGAEKGPKSRDRAAYTIRQNLTVEPVPSSSVLRLTYKSQDPAVVQPILAAIVEAYQKKHVEVHRGTEAGEDFLSQETDQLRSRLAQTEDSLRKAKAKAGVISLEDSKKAYAEQLAQIQQAIFSTEAELAERSATLQAVTTRGSGGPAAAAGPAAPDAQLQEYQTVRLRLAGLQKSEQELLGQFTEENQRVKDVRAQIAEADGRRLALEKQYPGLSRLAPISLSTSPLAVDVAGQTALLAGLQSKIKVLNAELEQTKAGFRGVDQAETSITDLERQKQLDEANFQYYSTHLEGARMGEALGVGRAVNIATVQAPSPPRSDRAKTYKGMGIAAAAGILLGLAWAFLIELYLDHSIRRPIDVERRLRIPLFLSMPVFGRKDQEHQVFHDTLRDRLIGYFESRNLTHKPKLVAVTGVGRGSGVTATAAGLARSFSEVGDGNVLLVDMTAGRGSAQQFSKGKADCGLDELFDTRESAQVEDNLYVVVEDPKSDKLTRALPTRFNRLVPRLKESNFDYIIFDMPPVNQISITPRLASFMDMVLLVVESERSAREVVEQAVGLLTQSNSHVGAILNKTRNYLPSNEQHEFLGLV